MKRRSIIGLLGVTPFSLVAHNTQKNNPIVASLIKRWEKSGAYSLAVFEAMPNELIEFSPSEEQLTFVQLFVHIGFFNVLFHGFMMDPKDFVDFESLMASDYLIQPPDGIDLFKPSKMTERDGAKIKGLISEYIRNTNEFVVSTLKQIDDDFLSKGEQKSKPWFLDGHTNLDLILRGENHTAHHRAQATYYLRMNGIKPPSYAEYNVLK